MIWDVWVAIFDLSELDFLVFRWCVLSETYDLGFVVSFLDFSELGFLAFHRCVLSETYDLGWLICYF
jgi:hypothetical protein